ncbi:MAG: ParA family protein [Pseudomonadota bacterium]
MRILTVLNQKGGVGKTTLVVNLGAALGQLRPRAKVLLVDLDPQAHLTYSLGLAAHELATTLYDLLRGRAGLAEALRPLGPGLDLLPASLDLASAELECAAVPGREFLLREILAGPEAGAYDFVFMDCPPNLGLLTINALAASQEILIPIQTEFLALQSLGRLMETIAVVQRRLNPVLRLAGIVATRFDRRKRLGREVLDKVAEHFGPKLFKASIRDNVALAEAPSHGQDIFRYRPGSHGAADYRALAQEFLRRGRP